jgi:hypothetical protein
MRFNAKWLNMLQYLNHGVHKVKVAPLSYISNKTMPHKFERNLIWTNHSNTPSYNLTEVLKIVAENSSTICITCNIFCISLNAHNIYHNLHFQASTIPHKTFTLSATIIIKFQAHTRNHEGGEEIINLQLQES